MISLQKISYEKELFHCIKYKNLLYFMIIFCNIKVYQNKTIKSLYVVFIPSQLSHLNANTLKEKKKIKILPSIVALFYFQNCFIFIWKRSHNVINIKTMHGFFFFFFFFLPFYIKKYLKKEVFYCMSDGIPKKITLFL